MSCYAESTDRIKPVKRDPKSGHFLLHPAFEGWRPTDDLFQVTRRKAHLSLRVKGFIIVCAFKGATCYEAQILGAWIKVPFKRFRAIGCEIKRGWDPNWLKDQMP